MSRIVRLAGGVVSKPVGDLDLSSGINSGLIWCLGSHPAGSPLLGTELVSRNVGTLNGTSAYDADHPTELWKSLNIPEFTDNWVVPISSAFETAIDGSNIYSAAIYYSLTAGENLGVFFCLPWFDSSWAYPFRSFGLHRQGLSSSRLQHVWADGDREATGNTAGTNWWNDDTVHWASIARSGTTFEWYADGALIQSKATFTTKPVGFNASGSSKMVLGSRNDVSPAEGSKMKIYSLSIWDRKLSGSEFSSLNSDPTQQFIT